jgi:oligo-1,6-glucosidase
MVEGTRKWWKEAVIYQVYPRSFKDSDGDGVGDLKGILSELDYIASLGIDAVWINPVYASPGTDNGYDISDYRAVQPLFGSMADLDKLIGELHRRGIRLIMDMVINHTSEEHEWFRQARTGRDNPYYSYYHWWPAEKGKPPYRCGFFDPAGEGWRYNEATDSWYLHYFSPQQPDLNWENPVVRREMYELLKFWLDRGVDGFRMDAITFISKDEDFPEISPELLEDKYYNDWGHYYATGPHLHEHLRELHEQVAAGRDIVIIGEGSGILSDKASDFADEARAELDMLYHFEGISIGYLPGEFKKVDPAGYSIAEFKKVYSRWDKALAGKGWGALYLGNHDQPRMISRWGDDNYAFREVSAKLLFTFLLTMRATPFIYNGDEIGMTNIRFDKIEDYADIETKHKYQVIKDSGGDTDAFLKDQQLTARDNSRTPFQWDAGTNAGFTDGKPWMMINGNYPVVNKAMQEADPGSILQYVRKLIRLRKDWAPVLIYGEYSPVGYDDPAVYGYLRTSEDSVLTIILNFTKKEVLFRAIAGRETGAVLLNNYPDINWGEDGIRLHPYQAVVFGRRSPHHRLEGLFSPRR